MEDHIPECDVSAPFLTNRIYLAGTQLEIFVVIPVINRTSINQIKYSAEIYGLENVKTIKADRN